jgi:hypothetical protein
MRSTVRSYSGPKRSARWSLRLRRISSAPAAIASEQENAEEDEQVDVHG